jgi:hypothetical protein
MRPTLISFGIYPSAISSHHIPKHAVSTAGKRTRIFATGVNCRSQNLILSNLCLMSAPVAVVNHHCTLACPKIACTLRPINPVVLRTEVATIKVHSRRSYVASVLLDYVPRRIRVIMALVGAGELDSWRLKLWLSYFWTNHRCLAELCLGPMRGMTSTS